MKYQIKGEPMPVVICELDGGESVICENGTVLAEGEKYSLTGSSCIADVDVEALDRDRQVYPRFHDTFPAEDVNGVVE